MSDRKQCDQCGKLASVVTAAEWLLVKRKVLLEAPKTNGAAYPLWGVSEADLCCVACLASYASKLVSDERSAA